MKNTVLVLIPELADEHKRIVKEELGEGFDAYFDVTSAPIDKVEILMVFRWEGVVEGSLIEQMKSLRLVQAITAGIDHIPVKDLTERGIAVQGARVPIRDI